MILFVFENTWIKLFVLQLSLIGGKDPALYVRIRIRRKRSFSDISFLYRGQKTLMFTSLLWRTTYNGGKIVKMYFSKNVVLRKTAAYLVSGPLDIRQPAFRLAGQPVKSVSKFLPSLQYMYSNLKKMLLNTSTW